MHYHIYLPVNVARKKFTKAVLVGHEIENAIVVVQFFAELPKNLAGLSVVAGLNKSVEGRPLLVYDENLGRHFVEEDGHTYTVVTFAPPNLRNLEYFTVDAILLQSTGKVEKSSPAETSIAQSVSMLPTKSSLEEGCAVFGENVLEKINSCQSDRDTLDRLNKRSWRLPSTPTLSWVPSQLVFLLHFLIFCMISILTFCINCLNHTVLGMSLVERLAFFKQLDLRLRQVAYFPAQFLFYRNSAILTDPSSDWPEILQLPVYNEKYNINNSNYINLYNSIWLIVNDMLIGLTLHNTFTKNREFLLKLLNETLLNDFAVAHLHQLVQWVSKEHPYGFKLNDELGQFMGLMFTWTLEAWGNLFLRALEIANSQSILISYVFKCICYMGFLFIIAAVVDYVNLVTIHIHFFNVVTTKVYFRQIEALKSLWQLFRGKKYNVLRNRIDNLDEDQFRVDRLLLGTLMFTILIYLLPTTFAFYLLFYAAEALILTGAKWCSKLLVVLNMYPLFVLLLKLKNSRRLQGGIIFESRGGAKSTNWVHMSNKALTSEEIFVNFWRVFRNEGKIERIVLNFAEGRHIRVRDTASMKFHYLRLPAQYDKLIEHWRSAGK